MDLDEKQKEIIQNKINHGWPIDDINWEFCLLYGEVAEAYEAYNKNYAKEELGSELADVGIYLLGLAEELGFSLQDEIIKKMETNKHRKYVKKDGKTIKIDDREKKDDRE
ncbi:MAG: hypothetical protein J6T39_00480 [Clostridia bacterium]|nr:hypothetical protein [Clostridia bacterium]